jgi:hypothetical protein
MSLQGHVNENRNQVGVQTEAKNALLTAITKAVDEVKSSSDGLNYDIARLKDLAEAYALVVHGKSSS